MIGIGMPSSQSRIKPMAILLSARASRLIFPRPDYAFPGAVAQLPAFDCGEAGSERADEHGSGQPQGQFGGGLTGLVGGGFGLVDHIRDALLGIRLAHPRARRDDLRQIRAIRSGKLAALA